MNDDIEIEINKSITSANRLRRFVLEKNKYQNIDDILKKEIQALLKATNDKDYNLLLQTIVPLYSKYRLKVPDFLYSVLKNDEYFVKIMTAFIFGIKGVNKEKLEDTIMINNEKCYSIQSLSKKLNVDYQTVSRWIRKGLLTKQNTNMKKIYVSESELNNFLNKRKK